MADDQIVRLEPVICLFERRQQRVQFGRRTLLVIVAVPEQLAAERRPDGFAVAIPGGFAFAEQRHDLAATRGVERHIFVDELADARSEEHTSELQPLMRRSYAG